jgi:OmpA-OmpF porin, OOP family
VNNAFEITRNHYTISPVYFDYSKSIYKMESFVILDEVAFILLANPTYKVVIKGHTDATGTAAGNKNLSVSRAKICYLYLERKGVPTKRMSYKGFGQTIPVADNDSEKSKQLNRRVEFIIITD